MDTGADNKKLSGTPDRRANSPLCGPIVNWLARFRMRPNRVGASKTIKFLDSKQSLQLRTNLCETTTQVDDELFTYVSLSSSHHFVTKRLVT